jgi:hypothetical protein
MTGVERIAAERKRQIEEEGFTAEHDDGYVNRELVRVAIAYADGGRKKAVPMFWPLAVKWWKPTPGNRIRELEKAGALIAAEIDRLLRLEGVTNE